MIGWNSYLCLYYIRLDPFLTILNLISYIQRTLQRFPGQSGVQTVPEPPQPLDKSACVRSRERLVCEGGMEAQASGLAQAQGSDNKSLPKSKLALSINSYSEDASAFPWQSGAQTVPEPPQPHDKSASVRSRERLVCEGGTGARLSGLA